MSDKKPSLESTPPTSMTIATPQAPPFAFRDANGEWTGIAIELWNQIAARNSLNFRYTELGLPEMLASVAEGRVNGAVAALTITREREQRLDFSHPFHSAGLVIAVPHRGASLVSMIGRLISPGFLTVIAGLFVLLIAVGVLI